jgi:hypothetical protein
MCITIVRSHEEVEFEPSQPLEYQVRGAKQVVISYDPDDNGIRSFMEQMDRIVKTGVSCQMNIKVNNNSYLNGQKLDRQLKKLSVDLDVNEVVKVLVNNHLETDRKLNEISEMCLKEK